MVQKCIPCFGIICFSILFDDLSNDIHSPKSAVIETGINQKCQWTKVHLPDNFTSGTSLFQDKYLTKAFSPIYVNSTDDLKVPDQSKQNEGPITNFEVMFVPHTVRQASTQYTLCVIIFFFRYFLKITQMVRLIIKIVHTFQLNAALNMMKSRIFWKLLLWNWGLRNWRACLQFDVCIKWWWRYSGGVHSRSIGLSR